MEALSYITVPMVRGWGPCYDPTKIVPKDWRGTALDVLDLPISAKDKLWVVLREDVLPKAILNEVARWYALQVADLWDAPDVVRQYLETGDESLRDAVLSTPRGVAWNEARDAARDAARGAVRGAAAAAAVDAAEAMAWDEARNTAWGAAREAVFDAAWNDAMAAQVEKLKDMLCNHQATGSAANGEVFRRNDGKANNF